MEITIPQKLKKEITSVRVSYGYDDEKDFIQDAIWRRILALKKISFLKSVSKIREQFKKSGLTEQDILKDFEEFSHNR